MFPSEAELQIFRHRLGTLLLEKRLITMTQLDEALRQQKLQHRPLGTILIDMGAINEEDLEQVLQVA